MHEPVFADVEIPATGMAMPIVRQSTDKISLELIVLNEDRK